MAVINGDSGNNSLTGTDSADQITGDGGNDTINALAGDDTIYGDYGPDGPGEDGSEDASALDLDFSKAQNESADGTSVEYRDIAFLEDGTAILGKLTVVSKSEDELDVDLTGGDGFEILLNSGNDRTLKDETATIRLEFFNQETGEPIAIDTVGTFADIDGVRNSGIESVSISKEFVSGIAVSDSTDLLIEDNDGNYVVSGTTDTNPNDQDAWFSTQIEGEQFIEFTVTSRATRTGYTFNGNLIDDPVIIPNEPGNDSINGGDGDDLIYGNDGNDTLNGDAGNDTIIAGNGADRIDGGAGDDEIRGGGDNDVLGGGDDADTIYVDTLGTNGVNNTVVDGGSGGNDFDTLDISDLFEDGWTVTNYVQNPETNGAPGFNGQIQLQKDGQFANINFFDIEKVIICFAPGTMIATPTGERPVESLREGDRVFTRDNGVQRVRWAGHRSLTSAELEADPALRPVKIKAGALGNNMPEHDMFVSPNHRMLLADDRTELYFDEREVLVAAKHLTKMKGISRDKPADGVSYHHILFDQHEIILGNGAWSESFQPGDYSLGGIGSAQRDEILKLFPDLSSQQGRNAYASARRTLKRLETGVLAI